MALESKIEWTESTWNPVRGCARVSEGCRFCYAERIALRFAGKGLAYEGLAIQTKSGPRWTNRIKRVSHLLEQPLKWKKPKLIFVNSMSDMFHEAVSPQYIRRIFDVMKQSNWHHFQVLTKRAERLEELSPEIEWPENVWMGVSVENQDYISRIDHLRRTNARIKFLSLEPLLGPLPDLDLRGIHWVIVGGESGPGARPMKEEWVLEIRDNCKDSGVPFFFKQWGGVNKKRAGRELQGQTWDELPAVMMNSQQSGGAEDAKTPSLFP